MLRTTTDFFLRYLDGSKAAGDRIAHDGKAGVATVHDAPGAGEHLTAALQAAPKTDRHATLSAPKGLTNGQSVTVHWRGYRPGKVVNVVECSGSGTAECDVAGGRILVPDPKGSGSVALTIVEGTVGAGVCDASATTCTIVVNDAGLEISSASVRIPISFAKS